MKVLAALLLIAACGGSKGPVASTTTSPASSVPAKPTLPDAKFEDLDPDQKAEFMKQKVVPAMEPIFKNHDAKRYAEFGCATCHGKQVKDGHFDMPSTDLPKLEFKAMSKWDKADLDWMRNEVKPAMAKLLSRTEYSEANPTGFGCGNCHTTD
jgi:hypothetical protein